MAMSREMPASAGARVSHLFGSGSRDLHGMDFEAVHAGSHRGIIFEEPPCFSFIGNLEHGHAKSAPLGHYRAINEDFAGLKLFVSVSAMLSHQGALRCGHVARKGWPGRD